MKQTKYFILTIDDGTIYDKKVIDILNRHHIKGTFNLNSGLDDFAWYKGDRPVRRSSLPAVIDIYEPHERASHSLTHPHITLLSDDGIGYEVGVDKENLENIFKRPVTSFAFPFHDYDDRSINRIKAIGNITAIRVSEIDPSFDFPIDPFHIKLTSLDIFDGIEKMERFLKDPKAKLFVFASHAYDFEFDDTYDLLEKLCSMVEHSDVKSIYTNELPKIMGY